MGTVLIIPLGLMYFVVFRTAVILVLTVLFMPIFLCSVVAVLFRRDAEVVDIGDFFDPVIDRMDATAWRVWQTLDRTAEQEEE